MAAADKSGVKLYNTGGTTSSAGEQLNDFHLSRLALLEAKKKKIFSQLGKLNKQPKHYGVTFKKYHEYPILHEANINDEGIDADGVVTLFDKWYSWDVSGTRVEHATQAAAKARVGQVRIQSGQGNLYGGSRDFNVQNGAFPRLGEEGGSVNIVGTKRDVITASISRFGFGIKYTKAALDLDTDAGLLVKETAKVSEAYADIREAQIRNALVTQGMLNATYSGGATSIDTVDETSELTFSDLRLMEQSLDKANCPIDTKMIVGSTKIGTVTAPASRFVYVPLELKPALEDLVHNGKLLWKGVEEYADAGDVRDAVGMRNMAAEGEVGRVGRFRFIVVAEMPIWAGEGADSTDGADADGDGTEDSGANIHTTDGRYDAFPMLFVGDESFETIGLEGDVAKVKHGRPAVNPINDIHGDMGSIAISWYWGILINRSERIRVHVTAAKVA